MKVSTSWTWGQFDITASTNVVEESVSPATAKLLSLGLLKALYGGPSGKAEKTIAAEGITDAFPAWGKNKKGEPERPADFKRTSIPFTEERALEVAEAFGTVCDVDGVKIPFIIENVVQHEGGGAASMKRATALVETLFTTDESKKALTDMLKMLGMKDVETATKEQLVAFAHSKGLGSK